LAAVNEARTISRVVVVTGAAGAIGSATVGAFLALGFHVVGLDRDEQAMRHARHTPVRVDLEDERALERAIADVHSIGPLIHVVGIAGGALPSEPALSDDVLGLDASTFRASIEANLTTQFLVLRATFAWLRENPGMDRSVTFTSSFNALAGWGMPAYSAAKAGLIGMTYALTAPLGAAGIRVNVLAPGTVRTPRTERLWSHEPGHFEELERTTALRRLAVPEQKSSSSLRTSANRSRWRGPSPTFESRNASRRSRSSMTTRLWHRTSSGSVSGG